MTHRESHERERRSFWNGILVSSFVWALIGFGIVWAFEVLA